MDPRLVAWARRVKRRRCKAPAGRAVPVLWLFTDLARLPDPLPAIRRLPAGVRDAGLCGVVFRHDAAPGRAGLARQVAQICRQRRVALVVAGGLAAALGAGVHLRGGRWPSPPRPALRRRRSGGCITSSAHGIGDALRAARAGADAVFLSPLFPTASHPGAPALGPLRWAAMARQIGRLAPGVAVLALGGVAGQGVRQVPRRAAGAGAIGAAAALLPLCHSVPRLP